MRPSESPIDPDIFRHYDLVDEATRLDRIDSRLEFVRSQRIVQPHLRAAPQTILDIGGAAGIYSFWLADLGHQVHLIDAMPRHIEQASERNRTATHKLASIALGDARALTHADNSADAVLLMGPLYHLQQRADRIAALREARRVLRPGGLLFAAAISRFASVLDGLFSGHLDIPEFQKIVERDLKDGCHLNPSNNPAFFTTAYFHQPEELAKEITDAGLTVHEVQGVEGPAWLLQNHDHHWSDSQRAERLLKAADRLGREPSLLGASAHLLAIARR